MSSALRIILKCSTHICESTLWLTFTDYKETLEELLEEAHEKGWTVQGPATEIKAQCPRCVRGEV